MVTHNLRSLKEVLLWERMPPMVMNTEIQGYKLALHNETYRDTEILKYRNIDTQNYSDTEKTEKLKQLYLLHLL